MEKYKAKTQNFKDIIAHGVYEANICFTVEQVLEKFNEDLKNRKDLPADFEYDIKAQAKNKNYEVVYYPAYFYDTMTSLYWQTKETQYETTYDSYANKHRHTNVIVHEHSKDGIEGKSKLKVKTDHIELDVLKIDLKKTKSIPNFKSLNLPVYEDNLFYNKKENQSNGISSGREAANAKKDQRTYTLWEAHIVLVPIFRFHFEYKGKIYFFEMNLHNGEYCTRYKQKPLNTIKRITTRVVYSLANIFSMLLPIIMVVDGFINDTFVFNLIKTPLSFLGVIIAEITALCIWSLGANKRYFTFERATKTLNPFTSLLLLIRPFISIVIVTIIISICYNGLFI